MSNIHDDAGLYDANKQGSSEKRRYIPLDEPNLDGAYVSPEDLQDEYELKEDFKGLFVLFNHEKFEFNRQLPRDGTWTDEQNLIQCLTRLRYEVKKEFLHNDYTKREVEKALENIAKMDHSKHHSLIIVFLTHGHKDGKLYCYDNETISCQEVWSFFTADKCKKLVGKPKFFIFQACKGDDTSKPSHVVQSDSINRAEIAKNVYTVPAEADILVAYSTFEGNVSFRHPILGTWFIRELCYNFSVYGRRDDIVTLFTRISKCVAHHYRAVYYEKINEEEKELVWCKQMPCFISTLTRKFYLCKSKDRGIIFDLREENKQILNILQKLEAKVDALAPKKEGEDIKEEKTG